MSRIFTHVVVETKSEFGTVRSRHCSAAHAERAAKRSNRELVRRYPSGNTTHLVSYEAFEIWYDRLRQVTPAIGARAVTYAQSSETYVLAEQH